MKIRTKNKWKLEIKIQIKEILFKFCKRKAKENIHDLIKYSTLKRNYFSTNFWYFQINMKYANEKIGILKICQDVI